LNDHPVQNSTWWKKRGAKPLVGFQLRYIYFIDKAEQINLAMPALDYSAISKAGAGMYKGIKRDK